MPEYPSGTVAFLFTDIEGSTRRWEAQQQAMWSAVQRHFAILDAAIAANGGVRFKTIGDAVQAAFPSVSAATSAAVDAQAALRAEPWGDLGPLLVRMAIHAGEAAPRDGDYLAPALNRLARVIASGFGGQILLTETARALLGALPPGVELRDLGQHRLRDLLEAEHIYQVAAPSFLADFPPLKSLDRQQHNLPGQPTPLIGRETELAEVVAAITAPDARLVTLTGPGGTGKTRLALQAAADALDAFPDGVWFVPLASVSDPALVPEAIAAALGVREVASEPLGAAIAAHARDRRLLLVLDNMEQVVAAAPFLGDLLRDAPALVMLATSREPLRLRGERELPVAPLPLPADNRTISTEAALASPAVRLFVERAQAVKPAFALDDGNVAAIVAICRRLDGLPLAIELAAARIRILPPAALLARLDQRLTLLTGGARDLPERQQTLRAAIAWSHDLLAAGERTLFARLAVFTGGCTLEAAEAICTAPGALSIDVFDGIASLVQKSLLRQANDAEGEPRFAMLETILEFARERLAELPEEPTLRQAHADAFLALAEGANWDDLAGQVALLDRLETDHANLRQALALYEHQGAPSTGQRLRLAAALAYFWWVRGYLSEGRRALDGAIATPGDGAAADRAAAISGAALLAEAQWDLPRAQELHEEALALWRSLGDTRGVARALTGLGVIARQEGDLDAARALHQEALDVWRAIGDQAGAAGATLDLGVVSFLRGDYANAVPLLRESLQRFSRIGDLAGEATAQQWLGVVAITSGDLTAACEHFDNSLSRWRRLDNPRMIAMDLANLGEAQQLSGALNAAGALYQESLAIYRQLGDPTGEGVVLGMLGRLAYDRGDARAAIPLLLDALRRCWESGDREGTANILDALAEAVATTGDDAWAARVVQAADYLRAETGIQRSPVYVERHARVRDAVDDIPLPAVTDIEVAVRQIIARAPARAAV